MQPKPFPLSFPVKGVHQTSAFGAQPEGTCADALNVRVFDPRTGRGRGAQRSGLSSYVTTLGSSLQELLRIATAGNVSGSTDITVRTNYLVGVAGGTIYSCASGTPAAATGSTLSSSVPVTFGAWHFGKVYFVDGTNYVVWTPGTNTAAAWTASEGSLPTDGGSGTARLICNWRGRIVLSGITNDPHNWFMSCVGDATNFNYSTSSEKRTSKQPVAGNNASVGEVGDVVTGLIPYSDQNLIIGCDSSIWQLWGDPARNGVLAKVSDSVGMAWGRAFCLDSFGAVYFFSSRGGVYRMRPSRTEPRLDRITNDRIEELLRTYDLSDYLVRMVYADDSQGVHLFLTSLSGGTDGAFYWDMRTQSWWIDSYGKSVKVPLDYDGDDPDDRATLLGCTDGVIYKVDSSALGDAGTAIDGKVLIGPVSVGGVDTVLSEVRMQLADSSNDVTITCYAGEDAEEAYSDYTNDRPAWSRTLTATYDQSIRRRARGGAFYFLLRNNTLNEALVLEGGRGVYRPGSRTMERVD